MTAAESSVLSRKIAGSVFNVSAYPPLDELARSLCKMSAEFVLELTQSDILFDDPVSSMSDGEDEWANSFEHWSAFCLSAVGEETDSLILASPKFVAALGESMLGGAFAFQDAAAPPSSIEVELVRPFVVELVSRMNAYLEQTADESQFSSLRFLHAAESLDDATADVRSNSMLAIKLSARMGEEEGAGEAILSFHLPTTYVEKIGLLRQDRQPSSDNSANEEWRAKMQKNVSAMSVDLPIVIGKYTATLSELSRLEVGQVIALDENAHQSLDITLKTGDGPRLLGKGRLGAYKNHKAVKVTSEIAPT